MQKWTKKNVRNLLNKTRTSGRTARRDPSTCCRRQFLPGVSEAKEKRSVNRNGDVTKLDEDVLWFFPFWVNNNKNFAQHQNSRRSRNLAGGGQNWLCWLAASNLVQIGRRRFCCPYSYYLSTLVRRYSFTLISSSSLKRRIKILQKGTIFFYIFTTIRELHFFLDLLVFSKYSKK